MSKGKFIVIEGIDGSGKTTQVLSLEQKLRENGVPLHVTRECTDGPIGKLLRNTYLAGKRQCDEHVINYLYAADRLDHITNAENGMLKFINSGVSVLCDRYVLSSLAYDSYMHVGLSSFNAAIMDITNRNEYNIRLLSPDLTIFISVPTDVALERILKNRGETSVYETKEKLEKINIAYHTGMEILENQFGQKFAIVDGIGSPEEIAKRIWEVLVLNFFPGGFSN